MRTASGNCAGCKTAYDYHIGSVNLNNVAASKRHDFTLLSASSETMKRKFVVYYDFCSDRYVIVVQKL